MPECRSPLLGRDFLSALGSTFALPENENKAYFWLNYVLYKTQKQSSPYFPQKLENLQIHRSLIKESQDGQNLPLC